MATASLYGITSESTGLYGVGSSLTSSYFEWFIFQDSATVPATPTGGSWNFSTNVGTPPAGWSNFPPSGVVNQIWVSIAVVASNSTATLSWSTPGVLGASAQGILSGTGNPSAGLGANNQFYMRTDVSPMTLWYKYSGTWNQVTGGTVPYINLDTTQNLASAVGQISWDQTWGTAKLGMIGGNVSLQIGQEQLIYAYNNSGVSLVDGQAVYCTGSSGQRLTVALAQANSTPTTATILGIVTEPITNNSSGFITVNGMVNGLNTTGYADGTVLYLSASTPGGWSTTRPAAPNHGVMLGYVVKGNSGGSGSIFVNTQNGYQLSELHDVLITSVANNNLLQYDNTIPAWKNVSSPTISTINNAGTVTIPPGTDTLVARTSTDTLTNKTLTLPKISQISNTGTLTLPTSTDTLVGKATTDTLTNKTLLASGPNTVEATSGPGNSPFSWRNKIINGGMDIAQRGTSFPAAAGYTLDRWRSDYVTSGVVTITQQADAPSNNEFQNSLRIAVTTADTSIAATDVFIQRQRVEGYNVRDLIGKTFTLSFWVRSSKTGIHCVSLNNSGNDRSYIIEYTVNAANTWEQKTLVVVGGLPTAGTWNWTTGVGLDIGWVLMSGSNFQTTAGSWQTGGFVSTANQVNCLDTIGNIFAITGVQLEVGTVATPFEHRPYGQELALCQRYYARLASVSGNFVGFGSGAALSTTTSNIFIPCPVALRASPTPVFSNVAVGYGAGLSQNITSVSATYSGNMGLLCTVNHAAGPSAGSAVTVQGANNASAFVEFTGAEL